MFVKLQDDLVKWVEFEKADQCLFEYENKLYESLHELLSCLEDKELALDIHNAVLGYLNRHSPTPLFVLDTLHHADGYDVQWALDAAEQETGIKIDYFGVVSVQKFAGFSNEPINAFGVTSVEVPIYL